MSVTRSFAEVRADAERVVIGDAVTFRMLAMRATSRESSLLNPATSSPSCLLMRAVLLIR